MGDWVSIGPAMAVARRDAGVLQDELSERLGVRKQTISDWERGVQKPTVDTLNEIERLFGLPQGHFLRVGGFVEDSLTTEDVIRSDSRLRGEQRRLLLVALEAFLIANGHQLAATMHRVPR